MADDLFYECDQCGLCCERMIIEAEHYDALREPRIATNCRRLNRDMPFGGQLWMLAAGEASPCPFASRDGDCHVCDIYPTRPHVCLTFPAGGSQCQEWRRNHGLPALPPLAKSKVQLRHRMAALCGPED